MSKGIDLASTGPAGVSARFWCKRWRGNRFDVCFLRVRFFENYKHPGLKWNIHHSGYLYVEQPIISIKFGVHCHICIYFMLSGRISRNIGENIVRYYTGTTSENTDFHVLVA